MSKDISQAVIRRMPRYYRYLGELLESGVERISSGDLSKLMKVTASQIRQDLNNFGGFGQQGYGYNVQYLYEEIGKILGLDKRHNMIIIGAGNLGQAIANYENFETREDAENFYLKLFKESRSSDIMQKFSSVGIHRDDLLFYIDSKDSKRFASQGQQRSIVLTLKLALAEIINNKKANRLYFWVKK